mgnify:CR=1 FL=1
MHDRIRRKEPSRKQPARGETATRRNQRVAQKRRIGWARTPAFKSRGIKNRRIARKSRPSPAIPTNTRVLRRGGSFCERIASALRALCARIARASASRVTRSRKTLACPRPPPFHGPFASRKNLKVTGGLGAAVVTLPWARPNRLGAVSKPQGQTSIFVDVRGGHMSSSDRKAQKKGR